MQGLQADLPLFSAAVGPAEPGADAQHRLQAWSPEVWEAAEDWRGVLREFFASETGRALGCFVQARLDAGALVYPPQPLTALALTPLAQVKVVILGQDPYHGPGQAHGLAFSVREGVKRPPSLRNIFKQIEVERQAGDLPGAQLPSASGCLSPWARQGVLLLNTSLTVEDGQPAAHAKRGWEVLTSRLIEAVVARAQPVVFMLWGAHAQAFAPLIKAPHASEVAPLVLQANHPSPLSASRGPVPFMGCGHFARANHYLAQNTQTPISW